MVFALTIVRKDQLCEWNAEQSYEKLRFSWNCQTSGNWWASPISVFLKFFSLRLNFIENVCEAHYEKLRQSNKDEVEIWKWNNIQATQAVNCYGRGS